MTLALRYRIFAVALVASFTCQQTLQAEPAASESEQERSATRFLRVLRGSDDQPIALQTATVRYVKRVPAGETDEGEKTKAKTLSVDLIGAVHVGDGLYYQILNGQFRRYDALLYELVAEQGTKPSSKEKKDKPDFGTIINTIMTSVLELDHQMEQIDYDQPNFVHADLSPAELAEKMRERGESGVTLFLSAVQEILQNRNRARARAQKEAAARGSVEPDESTEADASRERDEDATSDEPAESDEDAEADESAKLEELEEDAGGQEEPKSEFDLLMMLTSSDGAIRLKRLLAEQFEFMATDDALGPTLNRLVIVDRNEAAMRVVDRELAAGRRSLGLFYGAAHLPDFEKRLLARGFQRDSTEWVTAWDVASNTSSKRLSILELLKLRRGDEDERHTDEER